MSRIFQIFFHHLLFLYGNITISTTSLFSADSYMDSDLWRITLKAYTMIAWSKKKKKKEGKISLSVRWCILVISNWVYEQTVKLLSLQQKNIVSVTICQTTIIHLQIRICLKLCLVCEDFIQKLIIKIKIKCVTFNIIIVMLRSNGTILNQWKECNFLFWLAYQ